MNTTHLILGLALTNRPTGQKENRQMDNETKHTPGPWSQLPARTLTNIKGKNGEQICQLNIKAKEDAALIAAAPTLLEALKDTAHQLTKANKQLNKDDKYSATVTANVQAWTKAQAAIAKAKGTN